MSIAATARDSRCPACGSVRDASLPDGLCTRCLLGFALEAGFDAPQDDVPDSASARDARAFTRRRVGRYWLTAEIDRGGVGIVYRAWQDDLGREVALKMLLPERLETKDARDRFRREAELMASLDHPGILPVYEVGEHEGLPYYAMKLAERGNLAQRIAALRGRYADIARLLASIALAVGHGHGRGVLHRDLKPSNIVFDASGQCMVTDFGLARRIAVDSSLTGIDTLIGTPRYVAPEVVTTAGMRLTAAADVYGLGAILYELLTGQAPFAELTPLQILQQIATRRPQPPRRLDATIPPALETICLRCLEKRPGDRYASAAALADALEDWNGDNPVRASHWTGRLTRTLPSRRRIWGWGLLATLVVVASALTFVLARREELSSIPEPRVATRTLAVLPLDLPTPSASELTAARALSARLQGTQPLAVTAIEPALERAQAVDFPRRLLQRGLVLGAFVQVQVLAVDANPQPRLRVRAIDVLRGDVLWKGQANAADIDRMAGELAAALDAHRRAPPAEAEVPRAALAAYARGTELASHFDKTANDAAIEAFQQAIAIDAKFALAHADLSLAYSQRSNRFAGASFWLDSAIEEGERAARLDPTLAAASAALGYAYYTKGWVQRSTAAYEQELALGSDNDSDLALTYYEIGRLDESFHLYRQSLEFAPRNGMLNYLAAQVLLTLGATEAGERFMQTAIALEPQAGKRREMAAEVALYRGDYARCRTLATALDPGLVSGGFYSAGDVDKACAKRQHDWPAVLAILQREKQDYASGTGDLGNAGPALQEAITLEALGRHAEGASALAAARRAAQAAIDGGREFPQTFLRMASALRLQGETDAAYRMLGTAFAHGLTINARNDGDIEFVPFENDTRFAELRTSSQAKVTAMRERVLAALQTDNAKAAPTAPEGDRL